MRAQTITETKEITTTYYFAFDGTRFNTKWGCISYEAERNNVLFEKVKAIPHLEVDPICLAIPCSTLDDHCWVMKLKTAEELATVNDYLRTISGDGIDERELGRTIIIRFGSNMDRYDVYDMNEHLALISLKFSVIEQKISKLNCNK